MWDYPSMPLELYEILDLESKKQRLEEHHVVHWCYVKMTDKTILRVRKLIRLGEALSDYLTMKRKYVLVKESD
jgi:hypothetical protein